MIAIFTAVKEKKKRLRNLPLVVLAMLGAVFMISSCKDDYLYDNEQPSWLGESIYEELSSRDSFSVFIKLIDDLDYTEVLSKTGSKTLFVFSDDAFDRFFKENEWDVRSYEDLSTTQKKLILNFNIINNAYLMETLANFNDGVLQKGTAMRRATGLSVLDTVPFVDGLSLPQEQWWNAYRSKGINLLKDDTNKPLVHFLQSTLTNAAITNDDFEKMTGVSRTNGDAHIFSDKVIEKDITCKNGYVHVLEDVLIPPENMSEYIENESSFSIFSGLLERFCAPYYDDDLTDQYKETHPEFSDSIFVKNYFSANGGRTYYPNQFESVNSDLYLNYDPGWNSYNLEGSGMQYDMGAMFVPSNEAMLNYLETGSGKVLKERYTDWDGVPDDIAVLFLKRHMRESLILSVPSKFSKMTDSENSKLPVLADDIISSYVGVNGVVYGTSNVYPPDAYVSVYAPVLYGENSKVFKWAVTAEDFTLYLNSLESDYVFFVPSDDFFDTYIDPIAYAKGVNAVLKFHYNDDAESVYATVYNYDVATQVIGDSINIIKDAGFVANRLLDLLDLHIVVGNIDEDGFYFTKGGSVIKVAGSGEQMVIQGGGDINLGDQANVLEVYDQTDLGNGFTYFIDKPLQAPLQSVYSVLKNTPEFSDFFELANGFPSTYDNKIFVKKENYYGIDYNVKFFNTFNYTVYVPTNAAIQQAISDSIIHSWDQINDTLLAPNLQEEYTLDLERFLRYHFQDHSVYVGMDIEENYQTAILKDSNDVTYLYTYENKYYKLGVDANSTGISLTMDKPRYDENGDAITYTDQELKATVTSDANLYNIMARDYVFSAAPSSFEEIDGSSGGTGFENSEITTSSTAVIHQIDKILTIE